MSAPRWLFAEDTSGGRQFVVHTQWPRFVAEVLDAPLGEAQEIEVVQLMDEVGNPDPQTIASLMREAGDALTEYDRRLGL